MQALAREKGRHRAQARGPEPHHPPCGPCLGQPITPLGKMGFKDPQPQTHDLGPQAVNLGGQRDLCSHLGWAFEPLHSLILNGGDNARLTRA